MQTAQCPRLYRIDALIAEGFSRRTIHRYIAKGLLPKSVTGPGRHAFYPEEAIIVLRERRRRLDQMSTLADLREWRQRRFRPQRVA